MMTVLQMARISKVINDPNTIQGLLPHSFPYNSFISYTSKILGYVTEHNIGIQRTSHKSYSNLQHKTPKTANLQFAVFNKKYVSSSDGCLYVLWTTLANLESSVAHFISGKSCGLAKLQYSSKFTSWHKSNIYQPIDHKLM